MARIIKYGKDYLADVQFAHLEEKVVIYYWDLWISIILESEACNGDWDKLIDLIRPKKNSSYSLQNAFERLLSQIRFFQQKLLDKQLQAADILKRVLEMEEDADFFNKQLKKAKSKILRLNFVEKDKTEAMNFTLKERKEQNGLRGNLLTYSDGEALEAHPLEYLPIFEKKFKKGGFYNKHQSWKLKDKLEIFIEKLIKKATINQSFAIYRAFMTVIIEKTECIDDSFGVIGDLAQQVLRAYLDLDRSKLQMNAEGFFKDLLNLLIWEDYGYFDEYWPDVFKNLSPYEIDAIEFILQSEKTELKEMGLDYQKANALNFLGMLYGRYLLFDKFIVLAEDMGTQRGARISTLAEIAEQHQKYDLAKAVYEAALKDKGTYHFNKVNDKYEKLKERIASMNKKLDA